MSEPIASTPAVAVADKPLEVEPELGSAATAPILNSSSTPLETEHQTDTIETFKSAEQDGVPHTLDPANPTEPVGGPVEPVEPVEPVSAAEPVEPVAPVAPVEGTEAVEGANNIESTEPIEPAAQPVDADSDTAPVKKPSVVKRLTSSLKKLLKSVSK